MTPEQELEKFKASINRTEYAAALGFKLDKSRSGQNSVSMKKSSDRVVIAKSERGRWIYFTVGSLSDNGTIADFCLNRSENHSGEIRRALRRWLGFKRRPEIAPETFVRGVKPSKKSELDILSQHSLLSVLEKSSEVLKYFKARGIEEEIIFCSFEDCQGKKLLFGVNGGQHGF